MGTNSGIHAVTGLTAQLAVLEMSADEANYHADRVVRDAEREAQRRHVEEQVHAMHDKASSIRLNAVVDGCIGVASTGAQVMQIGPQYKADMAQANDTVDPGANRTARWWGAGSKAADGATKVNDLVLQSRETSLDSMSAEEAQAAEAAKQRAEDANTAAQRTRSQSDQKLSILQEMQRSDAELMNTLISRS